jgi:hypothetical protein
VRSGKFVAHAWSVSSARSFKGITRPVPASVFVAPTVSLRFRKSTFEELRFELGGSTWLDDDTIVFGANGAGLGLLRVPASGGDPTAISTPDVANGEREHVLPFALPGGRGVLFTVVEKGGKTHVAAIDLQSRRHKVLVREASDAQYIGSWSGSQYDGYLVYAVNGAIRGVRFDLTRLAVLSDPLPLVDSVEMASGRVGNYAVSRTGSLFYVPGGSNTRSLVWVDRQGRETVVPAPARSYNMAHLSPDGRRAAVEIESEIWIWDFARASLTRLTSSGGFAAWMPDSRRVMFRSRREDADNVYGQAADGSGTLQRVTTSVDALLPNSVTPDGKHLLGSRRTDKTSWDVVLFPLEEAAQRAESLEGHHVTTAVARRNAGGRIRCRAFSGWALPGLSIE